MVTSFRLFQDFQREAAVQLHACRSQQRADGSRGAALFADDLAQVAGRDPQFQDRYLLALNFMDVNLVGQIYKGLRDVFDKLFHFQVCLFVV